MPQSLAKVYLHITFSTKNRAKFIDKSIENRLFEYQGGVVKNWNVTPFR